MKRRRFSLKTGNTAGHFWLVMPAMRGVMMTLGKLHSSESSGSGCLAKGVEHGAGEPFFFERAHQQLFFDGAAAGEIDEVGARFHRAQFRFADDVERRRHRGEQQDDEVGLRQQGAARNPACRVRRRSPALAPAVRLVARTRMPSALALRANSSPTVPRPTMPRVLPATSTGWSFCHFFCALCGDASGSFFARVKMQANANSENTVPWIPLEPVT